MVGIVTDDGWTPQEAYCAFACIAIEADGSVGAEEQEALMEYLHKSEVLAPHVEDVNALVKSVHNRIREFGELEALHSAGAAMPAELREPAFRAALDLTWSDDESDPVEATFLNTAAAALSIDPLRRDALIQGARDASTT